MTLRSSPEDLQAPQYAAELLHLVPCRRTLLTRLDDDRLPGDVDDPEVEKHPLTRRDVGVAHGSMSARLYPSGMFADWNPRVSC